jgi:hypothetical protein
MNYDQWSPTSNNCLFFNRSSEIFHTISFAIPPDFVKHCVWQQSPEAVDSSLRWYPDHAILRDGHTAGNSLNPVESGLQLIDAVVIIFHFLSSTTWARSVASRKAATVILYTTSLLLPRWLLPGKLPLEFIISGKTIRARGVKLGRLTDIGGVTPNIGDKHLKPFKITS